MKAEPEEVLGNKVHTSAFLRNPNTRFPLPFHQEPVFKTAVATLFPNAVTQLLLLKKKVTSLPTCIISQAGCLVGLFFVGGGK